jgi:hypothetical protein
MGWNNIAPHVVRKCIPQRGADTTTQNEPQKWRHNVMIVARRCHATPTNDNSETNECSRERTNGPIDRTLALISAGTGSAIRDWRARWLRSAGILSSSDYEPCTGIFVFDRRKQGCPAVNLSVARVSRVSGWGTRRVLEVSVRALGPAGSSEETSRYVFARRGAEWVLVAHESGVVVE